MRAACESNVDRRPRRPCRVVLLGMMGSGKTTVGRLLASMSGWPYLDNDELVDRLYGHTPRQILASAGERGLREAESRALAAGLECSAPCLVGAAAGTVLSADNRRAMRRSGVVVWLRASAHTLVQRAPGGHHRPWLEEGGPGWITTSAAEREPLYRSVAELTIETDRLTPAQTAQRALQYLAELGCRPAQPAGG
jgi:shikimate kinase